VNTTNTSPEAITRILVGVDASENAARAADWAASLAVELGARLTVAHALDLLAPDTSAGWSESTSYCERRHRDGESVLAKATARLAQRHPDLPVATELSELDPAQALAVLAQNADLLVTGTRGHGGFTGMLLGSVSNRLAAHAPCPVVVIGADQPTEAVSEVVLGLEKDEDSAPIDFAFHTAARLGLSLRAVSAFEPQIAYGGYYARTQPEIEIEVDALVKAAHERYPQVPVIIEPCQGVPVPTLVQAARGARLLVVGSHRRRGPLSFGPGHIVHGLLSHADTPVAVIPIP
jgi:nucleotide-binding universal stress UspA family protein